VKIIKAAEQVREPGNFNALVVEFLWNLSTPARWLRNKIRFSGANRNYKSGLAGKLNGYL
jgi:hypothetical protein